MSQLDVHEFTARLREWPEAELRRALTTYRSEYSPDALSALEGELRGRNLVLPPAPTDDGSDLDEVEPIELWASGRPSRRGEARREQVEGDGYWWAPALVAAPFLALAGLWVVDVTSPSRLLSLHWAFAWCTLALLNAALARNRERSGLWAFLLSLPGGPLVTLALALARPAGRAPAERAPRRDRGPTVRLSAGRCPYCHADVPVAERRVCATCLAVHHAACVVEHGRGCAACDGETLLAPPVPGAARQEAEELSPLLEPSPAAVAPPAKELPGGPRLRA